MKKHMPFITKDTDGTLRRGALGSHIRKKYAPASPLEHPFFAYFIMVLCASVDTALFLELFRRNSKSGDGILILEILGFIFCFDVLPIYLGAHLKKLQQGLTRCKWTLILACIVCFAGIFCNTALRIITIKQADPVITEEEETAGEEYVTRRDSEEETVTADKEITPAAIVTTLTGICMPILTSCGSFYISFQISNPLKAKRKVLEELIAEKKDELRHLDSMLEEYNAISETALKEDDDMRFAEMQKLLRAMAIRYSTYVRLAFQDHLAGDPVAVSQLSSPPSAEFLRRLDDTLAERTAITDSAPAQAADPLHHTV